MLLSNLCPFDLFNTEFYDFAAFKLLEFIVKQFCWGLKHWYFWNRLLEVIDILLSEDNGMDVCSRALTCITLGSVVDK